VGTVLLGSVLLTADAPERRLFAGFELSRDRSFIAAPARYPAADAARLSNTARPVDLLDRLYRTPQPLERERINSAQPRYASTALYERKVIAGFRILVHPKVVEHPAEMKEALVELERQLLNIRAVLPADKLEPLLGVRIWLEWEQKTSGAAEFHVSPVWLSTNGYNPDKIRDVEICNIRNFIAWSRSVQPWMVLHELAHAYHHRVLGGHHGGVQAAYKQAMERKLYDAVAHIQGGRRKAYATTNEDEYFAEITEAYFGKNDFFPYTRSDLESHDPVGFRLMQEVWGEGWRGRSKLTATRGTIELDAQ
jgi:hypothetical protein